MHIFVDESGSFIPPQVARSRFAGVGAWVVPSALLSDVVAGYELLRKRFVLEGDELKGSTLNEGQAAALISMLHEFDVVFDACLIDIGSHSAAGLTAFREAQAAKLIEHLTPDQHATLLQEIHRLRDREPAVTVAVYTNLTAAIKSFHEDLDALREIEATDIPILVLNGNEDIANAVDNWYALGARARCVDLHVFPDAAHGSIHQIPTRVAEEINGFLRAHGG